ncbi:MAG TPA: MauE/DoxX family redox-associated membrane protein [Ornithinibacter sp.]|nr:MauE/DoxX family redox-associated membrane protein [Ornithinibacter sp.]
MPSALLLPVLTCAVVLLVSGVAKLRAPDTVDAAFTSLEVPKALDTTFVRRVSPWVEVALGAWLVLATGGALVVVATLTLLLFCAYLALVARVVGRPEPVDCGCFGALGDSRVTRVTVWRNGALVLCALLAVVAGLQGVGLIGAVVDGDALPWIAMAALTAAVAVLVAYRAPTAAPTASEVGPRLDADGNYEREQTPPAAVLTEDGRLVLLSNETASAAHLLVFLSPGCGPCGRIGPDLGDWAEQLAPVVVRAVVMAQPQSVAAMPYLAGHAWYDPYGIARTAFGVATPAAVLLGTDGLLAGGPVQGEDDVRSFVAEVAEHLSEALEAAGPEGVSDAR